MYLTSFTARGIKCFEEETLEFPSGDGGSYAGWNVILGANATGKTTLLQAMAVSLIGASPSMRLVSPSTWVRGGKGAGRLEAKFFRGKRDTADGAPRKDVYHATFAVIGDEPVEIDRVELTSPQIVLLGRSDDKEYRGLVKGPYAASKAGWLVCGYGASRRFSGGGDDELTYEPGRVGRVSSLFQESVALKRNLSWLPRLYAESLDTHASGSAHAAREYETVRALIDQLLPDAVKIADVDTRRVYFSAPGTSRVDILELSDGYRSFLALVLDLLRQMADAFEGIAPLVHRGKDGSLSVQADGVVLIDEIDLHLHPTWQRKIGPTLLAVFPQVQFIVSTHSPFVAQAAMQDGLFVFQGGKSDAPMRKIQPAPRVAGWTAEQILLSPLFGLTDTRDPGTEQLLEEHATLRGKAKFDKLLAQDQERLVVIERELSERLTAPGELAKSDVDNAVKIAAEKVRRMRDAEAHTTTGE